MSLVRSADFSATAGLTEEEKELERRMNDTHKKHDQWAISHQSLKGRRQRWAGGDAATTYHTLSDNGDGTCSYWIQEHIRYRSDNTDLAPTPSQWEQSVRHLAVEIAKICERQWDEKRLDGLSDVAKGKQRAKTAGC